jgi:CheY-like chemotaxis protein/two-component sensor histidine kinase
LLGLINEILDLSKIESGTVTLDLAEAMFDSLHDQIERTFRPVAESRSLGFVVELSPQLPRATWTDEKRLLQVVKNLLSNAFKFTERGDVKIKIEPTASGWSVDHTTLNRAETVVSFVVTDSGIGVSPDKQKLIFEAFQQADTGTSRKYGGTGLGLSISRELARLLGGELRLISSEVGKGSTFALFVPLMAGDQNRVAIDDDIAIELPTKRLQRDMLASAPVQLQDDRESIHARDRVLLLVENDTKFANILLAAAREKGYKAIVTSRGLDALEMAERYKPTAITLDLHLSDIDGWSILDRLKRNPATRHIPVEIISAEDDRARGLRYGAFNYLAKPVTADEIQSALVGIVKFAERKVKNLLIADRDEVHRAGIAELIGTDNVRVTLTGTAKESLSTLNKKHYDCVVINPSLSDMAIVDLLMAIQKNDATRDVPIIIYGSAELPKNEQERVRALMSKGVVKEVQSLERLLDETALFLHKSVAKLPDSQRKMLEKLYQGSDSLAQKKVLVVDDDVRNIFALTSVLEHHKMEVVSAENGRTAIELLKDQPGIDIVLMDIMMPGMDGFETMRRIRTLKEFESLPMIALTAKAMKGDREKCIDAGASDYVSKPVDTDQLLSLMRTWLYR